MALLFHHGRYIIDPFLWVVGSRIVEVFAYAGPMLRRIEHESLSQAVVRFANGATGSIHASLLNHGQPHTPKGRIEILGHDASLLVGEAYYKGQLARSNYWQAQTSFGSDDTPAAVQALDALRADVAEGTGTGERGIPKPPLLGEHRQRIGPGGAHRGTPPSRGGGAGHLQVG